MDPKSAVIIKFGIERLESGEPLLLLPGTLCDRRVFEAVLARMPEREVIVADMTGAETARALAARILDNAPDSFALAGFSLGGIVALEIVAQAPDRVTRLALIDTTARPDPEANHTVRRNAVTRAAQMGVDRYISDKLWSALRIGRPPGRQRDPGDDCRHVGAAPGLPPSPARARSPSIAPTAAPRLGAIARAALWCCAARTISFARSRCIARWRTPSRAQTSSSFPAAGTSRFSNSRRPSPLR